MDHVVAAGRRDGTRRTPILPIGLALAGLWLWARGLSPETPWEEWLAQAAWAASWLLIVEWSYAAILSITTEGGSRSGRTPGAAWSHYVVVGVLAAALVPLSVVAETGAQWAANRLLYDPGQAEPTYLGLLRGLIDTRRYVAQLATTDQPLSAFSRLTLGWNEEMNPFAVVVCAAMLGNALWASLAMAIGTGAMRRTAPALARAFRLAALQAATAPLFTLGYFFVRGGDGLNVWSGLLRVLVGTIDSAAQVPSWIRVVGVGIFFLLPVLAVAWRLRADRRALGEHPSLVVVRGAADPDELPRATMWAAAAALPLLAVWSLHLVGGPWSWVGQTLWLALWLAYLAVCYRGLLALTPEGRAQGGTGSHLLATLSLVACAWPLATAGLVAQVGAQWLVAVLAGRRCTLEFFGWCLAQVRLPHGDAALPPAAIAAAFVGNALWAWISLRLAARAWRERRPRAAQALGLGALHAATAPVALCALMVLSIITRDRAAPGIPRYDAWHVWTHAARAALGASFTGEVVPAWLSLLAGTLLITMPVAVAGACFIGLRGALHAHPDHAEGRELTTAQPVARLEVVPTAQGAAAEPERRVNLA